MSQFHEHQPKDGDIVLHCGHIGMGRTFHCWMAPGGLGFRRPNGTEGRSKWITACQVCFQEAGGDAKRILIRGDGTWLGDEPEFKKPETQ